MYIHKANSSFFKQLGYRDLPIIKEQNFNVSSALLPISTESLMIFPPLCLFLFAANVLPYIDYFEEQSTFNDIGDIRTNIYFEDLRKYGCSPTLCIIGVHCCPFSKDLLIHDSVLILKSVPTMHLAVHFFLLLSHCYLWSIIYHSWPVRHASSELDYPSPTIFFILHCIYWFLS